jgi:tetratricopeptide (TPR) repeat protein
MRNLLLITAALLLSSLHCFAEGNYSVQWQKGNSCYEHKQYDSAAFYYEQIAALKPLNAELYYNLGNTYYRLNKIGFAVLNYERALKINPEYKEAKDNLLLAQSRISNNINPIGEIFFIRWWNTITMPGNATTWAVIALITFLLFIGLLLLTRLRKARAPIQLQGILVVMFLCFLSLAFFSTKNSTQRSGAVIMEGDAPLMNRELKGKPLMLVPEGTVVKIEQEQNGWVQVKLPNGREGWLQQSLVIRI